MALEELSPQVNKLWQDLNTEMKNSETNVKIVLEALYLLGENLKVTGEEGNNLNSMLKSFGVDINTFGNDLNSALDAYLADNQSFVESMSYEERQSYVRRLESLKEMLGNQKDFDDAMLKAYIRKNKYELETEDAKIKKMRNSEKGFLKMLEAHGEAFQVAIQETITSTFGEGSKTSEALTKAISGFGVLAGVIGIMSLVSNYIAESVEDQQQMFLRSGGYLGRGFAGVIGESAKLRIEMRAQAGAYMTAAQMQEVYNDAVDNGLIGLTKLTLVQQGSTLTGIELQDKIRKTSVKSAAQLKFLSTAIFGNIDATKKMLETMTYYRMGFGEETDAIFYQLYEAGAELETGAEPLLNFMNVLGERTFMTGQSVYKSLGPLTQFGKLIAKATSNPEEIKASYEAMGQLIQQFDIIKYMAVMKGPGDVIDKYQRALQTGPFTAFIEYSKTLASQLGVPSNKKAAALAFAVPELRGLGGMGMQIAEAILKIKPSSIETQQQMTKALIEAGLPKDIAKMGAMSIAIKDPQARLLDAVTRFGETIVVILAKLVEYIMIIARVSSKERYDTQQSLKTITSQFSLEEINGKPSTLEKSFGTG
jgi:hypothetical protein